VRSAPTSGNNQYNQRRRRDTDQVSVPAPASFVTPQPTATFILDPALAQTSPPGVRTEIRVVDPFATTPGIDRFVAVDHAVLSVTSIRVYAVPLIQLFDNPAEASSTDVCEVPRIAPAVLPGQIVWTNRGEFTVLGSDEWVAFSATPVPESVAAAAVLLVRTSGPTVLVDLGQQTSTRESNDALGAQVAAQVVLHLPVGQVDEAVLMPTSPCGYSIDQIARSVAIGTVRATATQLRSAEIRHTVEAVQLAQADFRDALAKQLRVQLADTRNSWEAGQPIAPNESLREERWNQHLDQVVAASLGLLPVTTARVATEDGAELTLPADAPDVLAGSATDDQHAAEAIANLTDVRWEPADDQLILVDGGGTLYAIPSRGLLLRPLRTAPDTVTVPDLVATGPTGPTPVGARAPTPWVAAAAVGHAGQAMVRTADGPGLLVDAGAAARFVPLRAIAQMQTELGLTSIDTVLITHPHEDHVRALADTILTRQIAPDRLVLADSWIRAGGRWMTKLVATLRTEPYRSLGYTDSWTPEAPTAVGRTGVAHVDLAVAGGHVEVFTDPAAHDELRSAMARGEPPGDLTGMLDSTSLLYVMGNETSPHRVAVLGDLRGTDILRMAALPGDALGRALTGVRVIVGFGHHLGRDAGSSTSDVEGYEVLFRKLLLRNGDLTIVVQSTPDFADLASGNPLLAMAQGMGARVVFAGEPGAAGGGAVIRSDLTVGTYGTGVRTFAGDPAVKAGLTRLELLRAADRTLVDDPEVGPRFLRLDRPATVIRAELAPEITRLEGLLDELLGLRAADLLDARSDVGARTRAAFRAARTRPGRTIDAVLADLAERGAFESALDPEVVASLRAAAAHASPLAVEAELLSTPREVDAVVAGMPRELRDSIERQYRELRDIVRRFPDQSIPPTEHLEVLRRVEALRATLDQALANATPVGKVQLQAEIGRLDTQISTLMGLVETRVQTGRDAEGNITRTEMRSLRAPSDNVDRAFGRIGQVMGAVMVIHSVEGLVRTAADVGSGTVGIPQATFQTASGALNLHIGLRMVTAEQVHPGLFVAVAVLEVGAILTDSNATEEQRDARLIALSVDQLCLAAGVAVMHGGALLPVPVAKAAVMGLGMAITLYGSRLLGWLGLDDWLQRVASYLPNDVTHVGQEINNTLREYEAIVGSGQLLQRSDAALRAVGATDPATLRENADEARRIHTERAHAKERELVGLFRDGYEAAATAHAGLRYLDALAAQFARLRYAALPQDDARAAIQQAFTEMDPQTAGLHDATPEEIVHMTQWQKLSDEQDSLTEALDSDPVSWSDVMEHLGKLQQVIDNARYRVAPSGGYRPAPMLTPGTNAYTTYLRLLSTHERALSALLVRVANAGGGDLSSPTPSAASDAEPDPAAAASIVQTLRRTYDQRVSQVSAALPGLADPRLWHDSNALMRALERAHRDQPQLFERLQTTEFALQTAIGAAHTALALRPSSAPMVVELVRRETEAAESAIHDRTVVHGLVMPSELDEVLATRRAAEDRTLAAKIDAALPRQAATDPAATGALPLSEDEIIALHSTALSGQGSRMTSTEHQLRRALDLIAPMRSVDLSAPFDLSQLSRLQRDLVVPNGTSFWTYSTGTFHDSADEVSVPSGATILLARVGPDVAGRTEWYSGPAQYATVLPISEAAVDLLGTDSLHIRLRDLKQAEVGTLR